MAARTNLQAKVFVRYGNSNDGHCHHEKT